MKTKLTDLLNTKFPIVQCGMASVATTSLVKAVCNAGGLGILAAAGQSAEELRTEIRQLKEMTIGKFGVNLVPVAPRFPVHFRVALEERVPVMCSGLRNPFTLTKSKKPEGMLYIPTVGSLKQALSVERSGADAVIVQGWEAGGHASNVSSMVLIPEVAENVKIPVIGAGGFCDGKGLAAALVLGAEGIAMGTRFAITQESPIPAVLKDVYIKSNTADAVLSAVWDGFPMRVLRGEKMKNYKGWWTHPWDLPYFFFSAKRAYGASWQEMMAAVKGARLVHASLPQYLIGMEKNRLTIVTGDIRKGFSPSGQVVGRIIDIPTCAELMDRIVTEADAVLRKLSTEGPGPRHALRAGASRPGPDHHAQCAV